MRAFAAIAIGLVLAGCAARRPAPVIERMPPGVPPPVAETPAPPPAPAEKPVATHTVKRGETLVGIALQYGLDYRDLAAWNGITNPNVITPGQVLVLAGAPASAAATPASPVPAPGAPVATPLVTAGPPIEARPLANTPALKVEPRAQKVPFSEKALAQLSVPDTAAPSTPAEPQPITPAPPTEQERPAAPETEDIDWIWPVKGKVIAPFSEASKGMDIAGRKGAPVLAAADGRVVYAGAGLRGYGKLVIIKHNNTWLSAYAHNDNILVKEQQDVRKGQKIAEMGATDADQVKLHFEVRRQGKPVDPARVLPAM